MATYSMKCPIHTKNIMTSQKRYKRSGVEKSDPIFFCELCKKYYIQVPGSDGKKMGIINNFDVYATKSPYSVRAEVIESSRVFKKEKTINTPYKEPTKVTIAKTSDTTVRIKRVDDEEVKKARNNLNNIRNEFPSIATDKMTVFDFMRKVCGSSTEFQCVVRNTSVSRNNKMVKKVEFYLKNSPYLKIRIPEDVFISFGGKISNGEFIVDEIRVLDNPGLSRGWYDQKLRFAYDGPQRSNWFYNITDHAAEVSSTLKGELKSWDDYLDWKRQLAELRIRGIKYIAVKTDIEKRNITFLSVADGEEQARDFRKFLNRNEVSAFSNKYSKNRWKFEFNREYQDTQDSGIDLVFMEYGETYRSENDLRASNWRYVQNDFRQYKEDTNRISFDEKIREISQSYRDAQFQEFVFELTDRASNLIRRDLIRNGSISDNTEKIINDEFYGDGYLATTQIGDFALLSRLQRAIDDLSSGKAAKQNLDRWLFDITKAEKSTNDEKIEKWQNPRINESQKKAVEKILSNPDICLIQGPPGTGKTTVIAEAIYQLVIRNKRVLVASQANLAVDNALERLISNPKIRAIRLGNAKKIDDSVRNITEEHVLESFYNSIVDYVKVSYLEKWNRADKLEADIKRDYEDYQSLRKSIDNLDNKILKETESIQKEKDEYDSEENKLKHNAILSEKMSATLIGNFCDGLINSFDIMFGKDNLLEVWGAIEGIIQKLMEKGIVLTKVGVDVSLLGKVSQSNRVLKFTLINAKRVIELGEQLKKDTQYGGESEELELLKLQESELREKMMKDPSVVSEWTNIANRIKDLSQQGLALSEADMEIFKGISQVSESNRRDYIKSLIEENESELRQLLLVVAEKSKNIADRIEATIMEEDAKEDEKLKTITKKEQELLNWGEEKHELEAKEQQYFEKYSADQDNILKQINKYKKEKLSGLETNVSRKGWEEIFNGLDKWVKEIPDYSQEKDIFLKDFINGCNVVGVSCTENTRTLTENGFDDFDVVIIDEVSKATPPELLIPMLRGRKIVLVGDHRQLPPLFNEHEKSYEEIAKQQDDLEDNYVQLTMEDFEKYKDMVTASLFEKYFENADDALKQTLTIQYRMHKDIMDLINLFYDDYLQDGNENKYTDDTKAHYLNIFSTSGTEMIIPERHAYWFDSSQLDETRIFEQRKPQSSSCENPVEAEAIVELLRKIENRYANIEEIKKPVSVGVISFYYDQVSLIRKMLQNESFHAIDVEVNTVDRFQGKEKEIILVSLVRNVNHPKHNIESYIAAFQRINVAFSRAQNLLIIFGAIDMYAEQPVKITDMNNGEEKVIYPYKRILEIMNTRGTFFSCEDIIPEDAKYDILLKLSK